LATAKLKSSVGTTYVYIVNNTSAVPTYCLSASNNNVVYHINTNDSPEVGSCTIINMVTNPALGSNASGWGNGGYGGGSVASSARTPGIGPTGGYAMRSIWTTPATASGHSSKNLSSSATIISGRTYTASCYGRTNQTTSGVLQIEYGANVMTGPTVTFVANEYQRLSYTFISPETATGITVSCRLPALSGTTSGFTFDTSNYMLTEGEYLFNYADGSTPGWSWNGTQYNSASTGPGL